MDITSLQWRRRPARRRRPRCGYDFSATLPPAFSQASAFLSSVKLWPLHSFCPLQSWLAALQEPLPLQSLAPSHLTTFAWSPRLPAQAVAGSTNLASKPAIPKRFHHPFFIRFFL